MTQQHPLLDAILAHGRRRGPLIGAHRGASARAPENTLAAFRAALEDGAELIELDVHLTRDHQLAVIHDETTHRTTGVPGAVAALTMQELRRLDAGRSKGVQWAGETVPELGDVFALARGRLLVNVEVKCAVAGLPVLAERIAEHDMSKSAIVSSFDPAIVRAVSTVGPSLLTGLLLDRRIRDPIATAGEVGASLLHVKHTQISAALVEAAHRIELGVLAWTVNGPVAMRRLQGFGVDAILSDDPRLLRATMS